MKKLNALQIVFCAVVASSSTLALAGATNSDATGANGTTTAERVDATTNMTPVADQSTTQDTTGMGNSYRDNTNDNDSGGYGWIGLLGLAGLAGLVKRDHVDHTRPVTR